MFGMFLPGWGMHLADMAEAQGDLIRESATISARSRTAARRLSSSACGELDRQRRRRREHAVLDGVHGLARDADAARRARPGSGRARRARSFNRLASRSGIAVRAPFRMPQRAAPRRSRTVMTMWIASRAGHRLEHRRRHRRAIAVRHARTESRSASRRCGCARVLSSSIRSRTSLRLEARTAGRQCKQDDDRQDQPCCDLRHDRPDGSATGRPEKKLACCTGRLSPAPAASAPCAARLSLLALCSRDSDSIMRSSSQSTLSLVTLRLHVTLRYTGVKRGLRREFARSLEAAAMAGPTLRHALSRRLRRHASIASR